MLFTLLFFKLSHPELTLLFILKHPLLLTHSINTPSNFILIYGISTITARESGIIVNFLMNDRFTFLHIRSVSSKWFTRFFRYHITAIGGTIVTLIVSFTLLHVVGLSALVSQAIAIIVAMSFNFVFHHIFTYRYTSQKNEVPAYASQVKEEVMVAV
jgi:putative flippase GtrA